MTGQTKLDVFRKKLLLGTPTPEIKYVYEVF